MNEPWPRDDASLPLSAARRVDAICYRFERAWKTAASPEQRPRIADYLGDTPEPERAALLSELIALDIEYRRRAGEDPKAEDYRQHFASVDSVQITRTLDLPAVVAAPKGDPPPAQPAITPQVTRIRCPHCHNPIQIIDDRADEVLCPGCGSSFRLRDARQTTTLGHMRPLGKFELLERVGVGAFGAVWRARDTQLDRIVALKIPHAGSLTDSGELERFAREARVAAQLRHPGIVTVHEVQMLEGRPAIVSDFIDGVPLKDLMEVRKLTFRETAALIAEVADALDYAHGKGLVHRDIKPANIMIEQPCLQEAGDRRSLAATAVIASGVGKPLVMDFGLALREQAEVTLTLEGHILGTPAYMSPEQAAGKGHQADRRSDVYSLGVILYELLTGELPFRGSKVMVLYQVRCEEPRPPRRLNDKIPRDLETICLKCLEKAPDRRYGTAAELAAELQRFLAGKPIVARPVGKVEQTWRWCRRNPRVALLSAAVLVLLMAVTISSTVAAVTIARERDKEVERRVAVEARALAEHNAEAARQEHQKAEAARQAAEAAHQKAEQNAKIAGDQRTLSLEVIATLVIKVQTQLAGKPGTQKLKQELLETALAGLRKVAEHAERSPLADLSMAEAYRRMGGTFEQLGRLKEARQQYEHLHAITQAVAASDLTSAPAKRNLGVAYDMLGNVCRLLGEKAAARIYYAKSLQLRRELVAADPQNPRTKADLALSYLRLGSVSDAEEAQQHYTEALHVRQEYAAVPPVSSASTLMGLIGSPLGQGPFLAASTLVPGGALTAGRNLVAQRDVWIVYNQLGDLNLRANELTTARAYYHQGLELMHKLVQAAPQSRQLKHSLAISYEKLGTLSRRLGQEDEAKKSYAQALGLLQPLAANDPQDLLLQENLVLVLGRAGQHREAAKRAEHLRGLAPENAGNLYNVACCYALCAAAVAHGKANQPLPAEEQALAQRYAEQALEALRQAVTHGFKDLDLLQTDHDLDYIRQHPAYAALVQQLRQMASGER